MRLALFGIFGGFVLFTSMLFNRKQFNVTLHLN